MAHKALGCLTEENGNYSKARIAMLIVGIAFLVVFIWLIVLSVETNNKEHSEDKDIYECESNPCENDGICFAGKNFHRCLCPRGYTGVNCEIEKPYCIIIDTYKNKWAGGKLNLSINNIEIYSSQFFKNGTQVIDECFSSFDSITIQNTVTDAWEGEIHVIKSSSQKDLGLLCSQGCENSKFNGHIVVTGSKRANCKEKACCLSGNPCKIEEDVSTSTIKTPATLKTTTATPAPDVSCNVTFKGGCKEHKTLRIKKLSDQPYSVEECFERCYDEKYCAGFFISDEKKSCHLYKNGCTKAPGKKFTYYSMNDCKVPDDDVDDKSWCCRKMWTDNVIPGESNGSMDQKEIKEWERRKCCSPPKIWKCCKKS